MSRNVGLAVEKRAHLLLIALMLIDWRARPLHIHLPPFQVWALSAPFKPKSVRPSADSQPIAVDDHSLPAGRPINPNQLRSSVVSLLAAASQSFLSVPFLHSCGIEWPLPVRLYNMTFRLCGMS